MQLADSAICIQGTFHVKFLIVDRKIALLNSNNIQDRPNLEMMIHLEGAVVESFYDIFLFSWHHKMTPLLPFIVNPPQDQRDHTAKASDFQFQDQNPYLNDIELVKAAKAARKMLQLEKDDDDRLAKLRSENEREGIFGGYGGRFQAALGAIAESRRGSFSADTRDQELLRDGEGGAAASGQKGAPVRFADAVIKAMDAKRKAFGFGSTHTEEIGPGDVTSSDPPLHPVSEPQQQQQHHEQQPRQSTSTRPSTADEPNLVNWNDNSNNALDRRQQEISDLDAPARAKINADNAQTFAAESQYRDALGGSSSSAQGGNQSHLLPALDLPGHSLRTPTEERQLGTSQTAGADRPVSPEPSERDTAGHPGVSSTTLDGQHTGTDASTSDHQGTTTSAGPSSAVAMRVKDYAVSDSASQETTPALAYSQYTEQSSKGPDTPPATNAGPSRFPASTNTTAEQPQASTSRGISAAGTAPSSNTRQLFSHILDPNGKTLTTFKFSSFAERRNMNISTGSSSAGSKPPPKKNWIEGREYLHPCLSALPYLRRTSNLY